MSAQGKPVVLAVDDDSVILNATVSSLRAGYSVRPFLSGETALGYLAGHTADLIILDRRMPGMSGFEALRRLKADGRLRDIPVIILTGADDEDGKAEALELGAVDYLRKPVRPDLLRERVGQRLAHPRPPPA